jgi:hypothetical protein
MDDPLLTDVRAVCAGELATWPGAEPLRGPIIARAVRKRAFGWEIDPAIVAAANVVDTPELNEQLMPVLAAAHERHALGYDRLRNAVCMDDAEMSAERARTCATLPAGAEDDWPQSERGARWLVKGAATAVFAGAVTAAFVERHDDSGRVVATAACVPVTATFGALALGAVGPPHSTGATARMIGGAIAGGVLGGMAAYALAAKPGARAPMTALALAPVYYGIVFAASID